MINAKIENMIIIAPDILESGILTKKSDIWSFVMVMLLAIVFEGDYKQVPMKNDRVDIPNALLIAKEKLNLKYRTIFNMFEQILNSPSMSMTLKIEEIRSNIITADISKCDICETNGDDNQYHKRSTGIECEYGHFICKEHIISELKVNGKEGELCCSLCDNNQKKPYNDKIVIDLIGFDLMKVVLDGREAKAQHKIEIEKQLARNQGKEEGLKEAEKGLLQVQIQKSKADLHHLSTTRCPRCSTPFVRISGCDAMKCNCGCGFCFKCLADCGSDAHAHAGSCNGNQIGKMTQDITNFWNKLNPDIKAALSTDNETIQLLRNHRVPL